MCQLAHLLHEVNIKGKSLKSTSDVLIITIFQLSELSYNSCQSQSIKFYTTTTIALPGNQINFVSVMHLDKDLVYENHTYFENSGSALRKLGSFLDKHHLLHVIDLIFRQNKRKAL